VVAPGEQRVERGLLQGGADRPSHGRAFALDVVPRHARPARGRWQQRGEHEHRRRLAGPVGAEEAMDLAGLDPQVDAVDGPYPALELADEPVALYPILHRIGSSDSEHAPERRVLRSSVRP
jgi:hypothetical protein